VCRKPALFPCFIIIFILICLFFLKKKGEAREQGSLAAQLISSYIFLFFFSPSNSFLTRVKLKQESHLRDELGGAVGLPGGSPNEFWLFRLFPTFL
jgi:hypothetical protein